MTNQGKEPLLPSHQKDESLSCSSVKKGTKTSITIPNTCSKERVSDDDELLRRFRSHCRLYFDHGLGGASALPIESNDVESGASTGDAIEASRRCLEAFHRRLGGDSSNDGYHHGDECEFWRDGNELWIRRCTAVRDQERSAAHRRHMRLRSRDCLRKLRERSSLEFVETDACSMATKFASKYRHRLGVHPLLAGLRKILEAQVARVDKVVLWTFDLVVITELGDGVDNMRDEAVEMLGCLLILHAPESTTLENEEGESDGNAPLLVTWEVRPTLPLRDLRRTLRQLPRPQDLDAKATGSLLVTDVQRSFPVDNDGDRPWSFFLPCCSSSSRSTSTSQSWCPIL